MRPLSTNLTRMPRSGIRVILDMADELVETYHLEIGEPGYQTPAHIQEAACKAMADGFTKYTPSTGLTSLKEAIQNKLVTQNGVQTEHEQIGITPGSVFALSSAMMTVTQPGDEVLISDPAWPNYVMQAIALDLKPVLFPLYSENGYIPRVEDIEPLVTPRTTTIVINTPANPTGAVYSKHAIEDMLELARRYDLYVISDEVYENIIYQDRHVSPLALDPDGRVISIYSLSKTYAMTGWRVGYYCAAPGVAEVIGKCLEPFVSCASSISQKAAEAALCGPQECVREMVDGYARRRELVINHLDQANLKYCKPEGAFYLMVDIGSTGVDSYSLAKDLLMSTGVAVAPGATFGPKSDHLVRLSYCGPVSELEEGIRRFCAYIKEWQ